MRALELLIARFELHGLELLSERSLRDHRLCLVRLLLRAAACGLLVLFGVPSRLLRDHRIPYRDFFLRCRIAVCLAQKRVDRRVIQRRWVRGGGAVSFLLRGVEFWLRRRDLVTTRPID